MYKWNIFYLIYRQYIENQKKSILIRNVTLKNIMVIFKIKIHKILPNSINESNNIMVMINNFLQKLRLRANSVNQILNNFKL